RTREEVACSTPAPAASTYGTAPAGSGSARWTPERPRRRRRRYERAAWVRQSGCGARGGAAPDAPSSAPPHRGGPVDAAPRWPRPAPRALPGDLWEACLDAPGALVVPAPGGGDMGTCAACQQDAAVAALPVLTAAAGQQTLGFSAQSPSCPA